MKISQTKLTNAEICFMAKLEALTSQGKLNDYYGWDELSDILGISYVVYYRHVKSLRNQDIIAVHQTYINNKRVNKINILKTLNKIL